MTLDDADRAALRLLEQSAPIPMSRFIELSLAVQKRVISLQVRGLVTFSPFDLTDEGRAALRDDQNTPDRTGTASAGRAGPAGSVGPAEYGLEDVRSPEPRVADPSGAYTEDSS